MKNKTFLLLLVSAISAQFLGAQKRSDIVTGIMGGEKPVIAIPVFRGSGEAQKHMDTFNRTLNDEISGAGIFNVVALSMMPLRNPQVPQDIRESMRGTGYALSDWSANPVNANFLAFGYTGLQNNQLVLFGWLYNVRQPIQGAQMLGKIYFGPVSDDGAKQVAREYAADILKLLGVQGLSGSKIFFVSNRGGEKQIWVMDYDGSNQKPFTKYPELCTMPSISPDGTKIAFTRFSPNGPQITIHATDTGRRLPFLNPAASFNSNLTFSADGSKVAFASKVSGYAQIHAANSDGSGLTRVSNSRAIEVEPKINPKTGADMVFVSGRGGVQQIYRMSIDGADVSKLTPGEGQASNPAWHPNGRYVAFSWTKGFEPGNWNIFLIDVSSGDIAQLTSGRGRNENPWWAPDGRHLVFASDRNGRSMQIFTMLADGSEVRQLTNSGRNEMPVWGK